MRKNDYSNELVNVVKQFLEEGKWRYSFNKNTGVFQFSLKIRGKIQKINYVIEVQKKEILVYGISPIGADQEDFAMMYQMAEFICYVNYGLKNGCFEFDFRDGEIRFRSFIDCDEVIPSMEVIKNSVYCTAAMYENYAPGITEIIFVGCSAKEAIAKCKKFLEEICSATSTITDESTEGEMKNLLDRLAGHLDVPEDLEGE